jgi:hypothetical protein
MYKAFNRPGANLRWTPQEAAAQKFWSKMPEEYHYDHWFFTQADAYQTAKEMILGYGSSAIIVIIFYLLFI